MVQRHTWRCSGLAAACVALLVLIALTVVPSDCQDTPSAVPIDVHAGEGVPMQVQNCTVYRPENCWFQRSKKGGNKVIPGCMEDHRCNFDVKKRLQCPFWASGTFEQTAYEDGCSTWSMADVQRPPATCDTTCCTADPGPGSWVPDMTSARHLVFQPDSGCVYRQYVRSEILDYYQGSSTDILLVGDSFVRQLFVRLLHILRGQERVVDFKIHTHATYATCDTADSFLVAPAYDEGLGANKAQQLYSISSFFLSHNVSSSARWSDCTRPPMQVHYMFGSTFRQQVRNLQRYSEEGHDLETRIDVIVSVMFWTHEWETPQAWLESLAALKAQPFVRRIFLLGIPTARVPADKPDYVKAYQHRNLMMREWAANQTSGAYYIDFDVLSTAPGIPAACDKFNKHYACHLRYYYQHPDSTDRPFYEPVHQTPVSGLFSSEDGECFDDVNAAVWQLYFNVAMKEQSKKQLVQWGSTNGSTTVTRTVYSGWRAFGIYMKHLLDRFNKRGVT